MLVTGHTGFKGGWLSLCLERLGAELHGISLPPPTEPNFFSAARVGNAYTSSTFTDIRDYECLSAAIQKIRPEVVFHLAAQALVRHSYLHPADTYNTNVLGVVHLLEALRTTNGVKAIVNVTTDKCYENNEWLWGYRENEPMGGTDPYSSSKACAELVTAAYRKSFLADRGIAIATARAGNVIGGGDWAADRLLPDFFRALDSGKPLSIRSPEATRPWQHVLEPVAGYIALAERLYIDGGSFAEPWNFGPHDEDIQSVGWIVEYLASLSPDTRYCYDSAPQPHEANYLKLDSSKARARLAWYPHWRLATALEKTLHWHCAWKNGEDMRRVTSDQISEYALNG